MKLKIDQEDFLKSLLITTRAVPTKPNIPILSNVLLETIDDGLRISATNLEIGTSIEVKAKIEKKGKITVPAKILQEFISTLPKTTVFCSLDAGIFTVDGAKSTTHLATMDANEYPIIPSTKKKTAMVFEGKSFLNAVAQVVFAAATEDGRPILTGVLFEVKKDKSYLVATDGYRLSFKTAGFVKTPEEQRIVIPAKTLIEVARIIDDLALPKIEAFLSKNENQAVFRAGPVELVSRLIDGVFPSWERIVPAEFKTEAIVDREEFLRAVKTTAIFARDSGNIVKLKIANGTIVLSANTKELGDSSSQITAKITGDGGEIAFNYHYLTDMLANLKSEQFKFEMIESLNPGKFSQTDKDGDEFYHIIMPVRVQP